VTLTGRTAASASSTASRRARETWSYWPAATVRSIPRSAFRLFDAKTGAERWNTKTADAVASATLGDRCITLALIDGATVGLDLATGKAVACSAVARPRARSSWIDERDRTEVTAKAGDETVTLRAKRPGTPMLKLAGSGSSTWERDLDQKALVGTSPGVRLLIAGDVAITLGEAPTHEGDLTLIGVSIADGRVVFANHLGVTNNSWTPDFVVEAGRVYLSFGGLIRAYDPTTGAELWRTH
jgi:outer membrane protein assembly factor BamB